MMTSAIRKAAAGLKGLTLLAGSEVDILADGSLDYDDDLLAELDVVSLDASMVSDTLGVLLKYQDDIQKLQGGDLQKLIDAAKASLGSASAG
jgi:histidinol phosphatase-like PHP family hydrolase